MKLHVLYAQRKQNYPGQYALEAIACMSEYDQGENPDYLANALSENQDGGEFEYLGVVVLEVPEKDVRKRLLPDTTAVAASVAE